MLESIVLGLVQGFTEFLPVSSSGHLVLIHSLFGYSVLDPSFDVFVQGGTVFSVLIYFRRLFPRLNRIYLLKLLLAAAPAGFAGLALSSTLDTLFTALPAVALGFGLTTLILLLSRRPRLPRPLTWATSFHIGLSQTLAILPGFSRSGATIGTALLLGVKQSEAFHFSFLLSIPVVTGASLLSLRHLSWTPTQTPLYLLGFLVAAVSGYFSLTLLARVLQRGHFYLFAPYTGALCVLSLLLLTYR